MTNPTIVFSKNGNWNFVDAVGQQSLFRILCDDERYVYVIRVGTIKNGSVKILDPAKRRKDRETWSKEHAERRLESGHLLHIEERCIPNEMLDDRCARWMDEAFKKKKELIDYMMETWGWEVLVKGKAFYATAIRETAQRFEVSVVSTRRWLETHIFYGGHPNALIQHHWKKGGPGTSRRGLRNKDGAYVKVLGRPTDAEILDPKTKSKRRRLTPVLFSQYRDFLELRAMKSDDLFPQVYEDFKASRISSNRSKDGTVKKFLVSPKNLPSDEYLKRVGRPIFKAIRFAKESGNEIKSGRKRNLSGGSAQDIVGEELSVLDIDGTPANNQVLFGEHAVRFGKHTKPTVVLAVDRASAAIVGWHVGFIPEDGNSYLACVLSAFTSKETELARWNVPYLSGMVHGCASKIFIDRGPGISAKVQNAIVESLRTNSLMAAPGDAPGKGYGEQAMRHVQAALAGLPGSTYTTGDENKDFVRRKKAKSDAVTLAKFMSAMLTFISKRNLEMDARHLLTPDMLKKNVAACPKAIYEYNKTLLRGDAAWVWPEDEILRKLSIRHDKSVTGVGFIKITRRKFSSDALKGYTAWYKNIHNKLPKITVYENPIAPFLLIWENPEGVLVTLEATKETRRTYEDGFSWLIDFQNKLRNVNKAAAESDAREDQSKINKAKAGFVSKVRERKMSEADKNSSVPMDGGIVSREDAQREHERKNLHAAVPRLVSSASTHEEDQQDSQVFAESGSVDDSQKLEIDF